MPIKKYIKKKIVKKLSGGGGVKGRLEKEFTEDTKLSGGGYVMEDVLKKENYPKKHEGGYIKKDREELKSEIKGMGPEGKAYLRDKLKDKDYEGILKKKYKWDLDKELYGMHKKGKEYLKDLVKEKDHKKKHDLKKKFAAHPSPHVKKIKHSLGQIIESKALKKKLREKEGISKKDIVGKANGGQIKLGKGVKARKKFLDSIGHKPFKHFEDKAEKDYKEGQTGYKNLKKRQKSTVPGFDFGISAAVMLAAQAAAAKKASDDAARARKQQAAQQQSAGEQEAAKGLATTGKGIMKADTSLASGGDVKKYRKELKSEIKGMGPEGKAYLRDVMSHKKYKGKLKGKYKEDLDKELYGMHKKGKEYLKDLVKEKDHKKKSSPHVKKIKHSLGQIIESKILKKQLREKENIPKKDIVGKSKGGWIQGAVKKPGALRAVAKKDKLIKGDEKLSASDLNKLGAKAKKSGNSLLAKRVSLAKTFAKMRKK